MHVHALGQIAIEAVDVRREGGATSLERLGQCAVVERAPWLRQIRRYAIDDFVAPGRLKLLGQLVVHAPVDIGEQPAIDFRGVAGRAFQVAAVFIGELEQARLTRAHRGNDQPVVAHERHVRILRQRLPSGLTGDPHPAPLAAAAIVVLDEQVEDAGAQECPAVDPIGRPRQPARPEIGGRDDFGRPREAGPSTGACCRILLERADLIGKRLAKRAQRRVVGHDHEARGRVRDPGGLGQDGQHHAGARVGCGCRITQQLRRPAAAPFLGQQPLRFLVERPERVRLPVRAAHRQARGLEAANLSHRLEPAALARQVEDGRLDRRRPHVPIAFAEPAPQRRRCLVFRSCGDRFLLLSTCRRRQGAHRHHHRYHHAAHHERPRVYCDLWRVILTSRAA